MIKKRKISSVSCWNEDGNQAIMNTKTKQDKFQATSTVKSDVTNQSAEEFLDTLDEDLMKQTFEAAHQDYLAGRCIPNSQLMDYMKAKYGWK